MHYIKANDEYSVLDLHSWHPFWMNECFECLICLSIEICFCSCLHIADWFGIYILCNFHSYFWHDMLFLICLCRRINGLHILDLYSVCSVQQYVLFFRQKCALSALEWWSIWLHWFKSGCVGYEKWGVSHEAMLFSNTGTSTIVSSQHCIICWTWTNFHSWRQARQWNHSVLPPSHIQHWSYSVWGELIDIFFLCKRYLSWISADTYMTLAHWSSSCGGCYQLITRTKKDFGFSVAPQH